MKKKIKVTAVSYLNTKPLLYGLVQNGFDKRIDLHLDIPSVCAQKLASGEVDLGLVPVAVIPQLATPYIISDFCIGAVGAVKTVSVFSDVPLAEVEEIYLDYQSRTSVELLKVLLKNHFKLSPKLIPATTGFQKKIVGKTAALVIGDRTIGLEEQHTYIYDLALEWERYCGLPFVFAAWVSNKKLDDQFVADFNHALAEGIEHIPQLIYLLPTPKPKFDLKEYFEKYISYTLDADKKKALAFFLKQMGEGSAVGKTKQEVVFL